ncbi:protein-disulfide reductase DsbD family protein [Motilimonas pumila]|uniref:protein-disulfide reductase DsbD family protein n=1 Tax=Motilimonas pumila TaxID=2303987 RepID=UPI001E5059A0|nr:protein-disulfide reductase DsbD domain-containing protein [Motilimonas pumila]
MKTQIFIAWCLFALASATTQAADSQWITNENHPPVKVRLSTTGQVDTSNKRVFSVLQVQLNDGWKTYWRSPGEGGVAPSIEWQHSDNLAAIDWLWPLPETFNILGINTVGYQQAVAFPLHLVAEDITQPIRLRATLTLPSCTSVCVLTDYPIILDIDPKQRKANQDSAFAYGQALSLVPQPDPQAELTQVVWHQSSQTLSLALKGRVWQQPTVFIDGAEDTHFSVLKQWQDGDQLKLIAAGKGWLSEANLTGKSLSITVADEHFAGEYHATAAQGLPFEPPAGSKLPIWLIALMGGFILNFMPCVLPVLGLKLNSIIRVPNHDQAHLRRQFLASAAGIVVSFWLIATALLLLKVSGKSIGWGIQFQQPWFLALMLLVTTIFAFNLLGWFDIQLPSRWQTRLATSGNKGYQGHFLQGMFATLLATPCSAPFLGTAVAFALAASNTSMMIIFTFLGLGMAAPWLLVAAWPQTARLLPKPGPWMGWLKYLFAFMLLATSVWIGYLLAQFISMAALVLVILCLSLLGAWLVLKRYGGRICLIVISTSLLLLGCVAFGAALTSKSWQTPLPQLTWQPLKQTNIKQLVDAGHVVFVDVTADWCITCKANKVGVLLQSPVVEQLQSNTVKLVQADWTRPAAHINDYLQQYNRYGVPFNIVYGPSAPHGIALPVILTASAVTQALQQASGLTTPDEQQSNTKPSNLEYLQAQNKGTDEIE